MKRRLLELLTLALLVLCPAPAQQPELLNTEASQLDTGAKRRTFKAAIRADAFIDVRDFAVGSAGVTDDGQDDVAAIQAAIDSTAGTQGVRRFYLAPGVWNIGSTISLKNDSCEIFGAGQTTELVVGGAATTAISGLYEGDSPPDVESGPHNWKVRNLVLTGPGSGTSTGYGISFDNAGLVSANRVLVEDCIIRGFARGVYSRYTVNTELRRVRFEDNPVSIYSTQSDTLKITNCWTGYLAGATCLVSTAPGTGVIDIDGGEHGNVETLFDVTGGTLVVRGANFETVTGDYAIRTHQAEISMRDCNYAAISCPLVRNSGNANIAIFDNVYARDGSPVFDGGLLVYQTNVAGDFPILRNTPKCWQYTSADFSTVSATHSWRDPLPFGAVPEMQRLELSSATASASANNGFVGVSTRGLVIGSWTTASSSAVSNFSKGNVYAPVLARAGDGSIGDWDWSRRFIARFQLSLFNQGSGITADDEFALLIGVPYNRTTTGPLAAKGIGIQSAGTSVTAVVHNGTTGASVALGTLTSGEAVTIVLDYDGAGSLKASMTGGAEVTLSGGPTGLSTAHNNSILVAAWNTTGGTAIPNWAIRDFETASY